MTTRRRPWLRIIAVLVSLYAVVGFWVLPPIVRTQLERRGSDALGRAVTVGRVKINPFALAVTLEGVEIKTPSGAASFAGWNRLRVNFDPLRSLAGEWVVGEIALDGLHAAVEVRPDGTLNFADLAARFRRTTPAGTRSKPSRPWRIGRLSVTQARIDFLDASRHEPFRTLVGPVDVTLLDFRPAGGADAPYRFTAATESGEKLNWTGTVTAEPFASTGEWRVENLALPKYAPYFEDRLNALLSAGKLTIGGQYEVALGPGDRRLALSGVSGQISQLKLIDRTTGRPVVELESAEIAGVTADGLARRVAAERIHLNGGHVTVRRETDGSVNLAALLRPRTPAGGTDGVAPPGGSASEAPFALAVDELAARDFTVELRDLSTPRPLELALNHVNATMRKISLAPGATMPVDLTFGADPQGTGRVAGTVGFTPVQADLTIELAWMPLPPFSPYLEQARGVRVTRGVASVKGRATWRTGRAGEPEATFAGGGRVEDVQLVGTMDGAELAGFADVAAAGVKVTNTPRPTVAVEQLSVRAPFVRLVIDEKEALNLAALTSPAAGLRPATVSVPAASPAEEAPALEMSIAQLSLAGGEVTFTDRSLQPNVKVGVREIGGSVRAIATGRSEPGEVELRGVIEGASPLTVRGRWRPLGGQPWAELKVETQSVDLTPLSPYLAKYAGYELERGRLFLNTQANVAGEKLDLRSTVTLEQFTLGSAVPGPDVVKLPVHLGVALLKDASGKIVLDLPIQGSLADPQFSVAHVAGQTVTSLLTKAALSPFTLLGSMFGGGGEELAQPGFVAGETTLLPGSHQRLATVARALAARPALTLEIEGGFDAAADGYELQRAKLEDAIRGRVWAERKPMTPDLPPVEKFLVSDRDRADMLTRMFDETYPQGVVATAPQPSRAAPVVKAGPAAVPAASVSPPPPALQQPRTDDRGFVRRTFDSAWDLATLKGLREWRAARKTARAEKAAAEAAQRQAPQVAVVPPVETLEAAMPAPDVPLNEMAARLAETMTVTPEDFRKLADARAQRVRQVLIEEGRLAPERLVVRNTPANATGQGPRVQLHLR